MLKSKAKIPVILSALPICWGGIPCPPSSILVALKMGMSSSNATECSDNPEYTDMLRIICGLRVSQNDGCISWELPGMRTGVYRPRPKSTIPQITHIAESTIHCPMKPPAPDCTVHVRLLKQTMNVCLVWFGALIESNRC
jgi:hypothetical protein